MRLWWSDVSHGNTKHDDSVLDMSGSERPHRTRLRLILPSQSAQHVGSIERVRQRSQIAFVVLYSFSLRTMKYE